MLPFRSRKRRPCIPPLTALSQGILSLRLHHQLSVSCFLPHLPLAYIYITSIKMGRWPIFIDAPLGHLYNHFNGSITVNTVPLPFSLSTRIFPRWASTIL